MKYAKKGTVKIFVGILCLLVLYCSRERVSNPVSDTEIKELKITCKDVLKSGENIDYVLQTMNMGSNERYGITESLKEYLDVKACMPGDSVLVSKNLSGEFSKLEYVKSRFLRFNVTKKDTAYHTEKIELKPSIAISNISSTISGSLYESIVKLGYSPELVFDYADIFAWVIDFLTEVQNGDTFDILVEKQYLSNRYVGNGKIIAAFYKGQIGQYFAFYFKDTEEKEDYYDEKGNSLRKQLLKTPLQYRRISSYFSLARLHPILKIRRPHYGVDFAAPRGTPVCSVGDGHILFAGRKGGYGKLIVVNHPNSFITYYGHLSRINKGIVKGAKVKQGQVIGNVGSTGLSTGPHLHFGIKKSGRWVNPLKIDLPPAEPINEKYRKIYLEEMSTIKQAVFGKTLRSDREI